MHQIKLKAYLSPYSVIKANGIHGASAQELAHSLTFLAADWEYVKKDGYTEVGEVSGNLYLFNATDIVGAKIAALKEEQTKVRAEAEAKATRLEGEIQSLLSIENGASK